MKKKDKKELISKKECKKKLDFYITKLKKEQLKNLNHQKIMFEKAKLSSIGELLSMIAHQFRQPLSSINAILMNLRPSLSIQRHEQKVTQIESITQHLSSSIEDFLSFYKNDKNRPDFSVEKAVNNAISLIKPLMQSKAIAVDVLVIKDSLINGYKNEYQQAIMAIVNNAINIIEIRKTKSAIIKITVTKDYNKSLVTIEDNAGGVRVENRESIFEPNFSTNEYNSSTGLGLYISKLILQKSMDGYLSVVNTDNGAKFSILL